MVVCLVGDHLLGLGELEALDVHVLEGVVDVAHLLQELRCLIHSQDMHISTASGSCPGTSGSGGDGYLQAPKGAMISILTTPQGPRARLRRSGCGHILAMKPC